MPYCSRCDYEFPAGMQICPDCHIPLLSSRPVISGAAVVPDDSWVRVCGVRGQARAEKAKGALDSSNIPSVLMSASFRTHGENLGLGERMFGIDQGAAIILVPREYREEALYVIESILGDDSFSAEAIQ